MLYIIILTIAFYKKTLTHSHSHKKTHTRTHKHKHTQYTIHTYMWKEEHNHYIIILTNNTVYYNICILYNIN